MMKADGEKMYENNKDDIEAFMRLVVDQRFGN
eukprot:CAMPEP_0170489996 /NCGR_PEP_ID=MMETSP0208-20121228/8269_1 /TAXON_ID=197538 /ORGANISM="Strombidium inclinatum, Strain S3" /LENGTH=31 /DNA_ID= /DNA_START= /DNA_END= /DNA_ORIENTATION=